MRDFLLRLDYKLYFIFVLGLFRSACQQQKLLSPESRRGQPKS
jgi:hypothetical protein